MIDFFTAYNIEFLKIGFVSFRLFDLIDVGILSIASFYFYNYIRGSIASQIFSGMIMLAITFFIANFLNFTTLKWIVTQVINVWIVIVIILFQPEIRRILISLGTSPFVRFFFYNRIDSVFEQITVALRELQRTNTGAIIVVSKGGLKTYIETGVPIDSVVTSEMIMSIFYKNSPLHDGAIIIENNRIEAARCTLPLATSIDVLHTLGTRHRAAIGITEVSDAISIVISEETGKLSMAENGKIMTNLSFEDLKTNFFKLSGQKNTTKRAVSAKHL